MWKSNPKKATIFLKNCRLGAKMTISKNLDFFGFLSTFKPFQGAFNISMNSQTPNMSLLLCMLGGGARGKRLG